MVVSFYKMFGYPTGVGALVAKKSFLETLARKWFSGGTVDFVQAPGRLTLHAKDLTARFEVSLIMLLVKDIYLLFSRRVL